MALSFGFAMTFSLMASRDLRNFTFSELVRTLANGYTSQCRVVPLHPPLSLQQIFQSECREGANI